MSFTTWGRIRTTNTVVEFRFLTANGNATNGAADVTIAVVHVVVVYSIVVHPEARGFSECNS